jgi:hypothetical protein
MFSGDTVEYRSACYCGDAHFKDWPQTIGLLKSFNPQALVPGRGDALTTPEMVSEAIHLTQSFLTDTYTPVAAAAAKGWSLKDAFSACRDVCDPKYSDYAIYEHCLPFNVARAYDESNGIDHPRIWTAQRDQDMWAALQQ